MNECARGGLLVLCGAVLFGCAGSSGLMSERAPKSSAVTRKVGAPDVGGPAQTAGSTGGGLVDYIRKPGVMVAQLGTRWGLRLTEIRDAKHRQWVARDLLEIERLRKKYKLSPPGRSVLLVAGAGLYAVLVLPSRFEVARAGRVDVHLWDYSGARHQARLGLGAQPGGSLAPVGRVVRFGARHDYVFLVRRSSAGRFLVQLSLMRGRQRLLATTVPAKAGRVGPVERP